MGTTGLFKSALFSLLLLLPLFLSVSAQSTACSSYTSFQNSKTYSTCVALSQLNCYLHWTYYASNSTADIAFRATGVTVSNSDSGNWVAWALNPSGKGMIGSQALVAYMNSTAVTALTSPITSTGTTLAQGDLSFAVTNLNAESRSGQIIIYATVKVPSTSIQQVWQVGPMKGGSPISHTIDNAHQSTTSTIDFNTGVATAGGGNSKVKKKNVHGVLNAVSWGIMMPIGAIIARYLKVFKSADPAWFYLHIFVQCSAYIIGVAGWGTGLKLGSDSVGIVYHEHRNIGITLFCLATLQVFALLLRPKKDHKLRLYWNLYHWSVGYTVIILSIVNIYKGLDILDPAKKWKTAYTVVIIVLGGVALVLEASTWLIVLKRKKDGSEQKFSNGYNGENGNGNGNGYGVRSHP